MVDLASAGLDSKQIAAIKHPGSVFLTACPGSGKTKTLTYKIATELLKITDHRKFVVAITYTHTVLQTRFWSVLRGWACRLRNSGLGRYTRFA